MKKHLILAAMAMTALFSACNNDDSTPLNEETVPVSFTIGGIDSRATTNTDYTTLFDNNDQIGISATNLTPAMNNVLYTVTVANSTTSIATTTGDYAYGTENAVFNAYYPYSENFNNTFSVQADQTSGIGASDFLTATATGSKENATVTLNFSHRLVLVEVNLTGVSNVSSVKLKNAKTEVTYTASTDGTTEPAVNTPDNSTKSDIIMNPVTASSKYWAIIPAQEIAAGNLFEVTTSDGKTYLYTTTSASTFTAKKLVKYSLTLAEEAVLSQYNPVTIVAWDTQNLTPIEGNLEEKKLNISATIPSPGNIISLNGGRSDLTGIGWGAYNLTSATVIEDATNGNYISVIGNAESGAWGSQGLYYWAGSDYTILPTLSYILTFSAKSESSGQISIMVMKKDSNAVFPIVDVTTASNVAAATAVGTISSKTLTSSWTTYKFKITPNKTMTGGYGNLNNATDNLNPSDICIAIKGNSASSQYDIKDITFVQL